MKVLKHKLHSLFQEYVNNFKKETTTKGQQESQAHPSLAKGKSTPQVALTDVSLYFFPNLIAHLLYYLCYFFNI